MGFSQQTPVLPGIFIFFFPLQEVAQMEDNALAEEGIRHRIVRSHTKIE